MSTCCGPNGSPVKDLNVNSLAAKNICSSKINTCGTITAGTIVASDIIVPGAVSIGPAGIEGKIGPAGLTGLPGSSSTSIIPFSTGTIAGITLATAGTGLASTAALLGFGSSVVSALAIPASLNSNPLVAFAFSGDSPRTGTITGLSGTVLTAIDLALGAGVFVNFEILTSPENSATYTSQATAQIGPLNGIVIAPTVLSNVITTAIPIAIGDKFLLRVTLTNTAAVAVSATLGISGGITIA